MDRIAELNQWYREARINAVLAELLYGFTKRESIIQLAKVWEKSADNYKAILKDLHNVDVDADETEIKAEAEAEFKAVVQLAEADADTLPKGIQITPL